ncbi:MAG TPA: type I-E CRISPR-associated protein Cas5/CasD [Verrucomicrobiota bacterium]|nr:type I-E CRISPR-associated protein Cas5/CasD [Verrucomicrobiota bacterium]
MTCFLVFRLYGPMASWGDIAVGEVRPSYTYPSKSAILGLVAAALHIDREQEEMHRNLATAYGFAVRVESMGVPLVDFHTVQVPSSGTGRNRRTSTTRRAELCTLSRDKLNTILSRRDYRMDALASVALWSRVTAPPYRLAEVRSALERPGYVLYLGRKSCPLALPLEAQEIQAPSVRDAFAAAQFAEFDGLGRIHPSGPPVLFWEDGAEAGLSARQTSERRDVPLSRRRWQFDTRREHSAPIGEEG